MEFEKESNIVLKFTVPTRSVARILGRGGASINEIKVNTGAQIDVDKSTEDGGATTFITVRGTKQAIAAAKAAILQISEQVVDEISASVVIESKFHRNIIGAGGQGLKELISRCGGPSDSKLQAGLIRLYVPVCNVDFTQLTCPDLALVMGKNLPMKFVFEVMPSLSQN